MARGHRASVGEVAVPHPTSRTKPLRGLAQTNPFFSDLARGAEQAAAAVDASVLTGNSAQDPDREAGYLELFEEHRVRGILITPVGDDAERLHRIRERGMPIVLVDRLAELEGFPSVSVDDVAGGRLAAEHLLATGRRRLLFVGGPLTLRQVADRLEGARSAVSAVDGASLEVAEIPQLTVQHGRAAGEEVAARPAHERPDAIFAANDLAALGILQALLPHEDARIPEQIGLIGYDDITFAAAAAVPLSSVRQPSEAMGVAAVELLDGRADEPQHIVFQPKLVVRRSTETAQER